MQSRSKHATMRTPTDTLSIRDCVTQDELDQLSRILGGRYIYISRSGALPSCLTTLSPESQAAVRERLRGLTVYIPLGATSAPRYKARRTIIIMHRRKIDPISIARSLQCSVAYVRDVIRRYRRGEIDARGVPTRSRTNAPAADSPGRSE